MCGHGKAQPPGPCARCLAPAQPFPAELMRLRLHWRVGVGLGTSGEIKQIPGKVGPSWALQIPPCPQRLLPHSRAQQPSC